MSARQVTRFFPNSEICVVHQNGEKLTDPTKGVEVILHFRDGEDVPCCAEVIGTADEDHYAEIGLIFEGKVLYDCDGVFCLPREVAEVLTDEGFTVPEEF